MSSKLTPPLSSVVVLMRGIYYEQNFKDCLFPTKNHPRFPEITSVEHLQDTAERRFWKHFTRLAALSWFQHEEKPSITPMHRKEKTDDSSYPPSILRKRPPVDQAVGEKRRAERRVRFREPEEVIEHGKSRAGQRASVGYLDLLSSKSGGNVSTFTPDTCTAGTGGSLQKPTLDQHMLQEDALQFLRPHEQAKQRLKLVSMPLPHITAQKLKSLTGNALTPHDLFLFRLMPLS
ncbi:hypothetical protein DV515_00001913 [Chloebia gouldiae]|uniref:Uncharacterized protein n=1 Tax=Chloebia gouldiae TaxID=44316 RepID=A0A3L8SWH2_CHLGU|nr:hypothetical protein DV515_00001913 [Chloebia gouldiae]